MGGNYDGLLKMQDYRSFILLNYIHTKITEVQVHTTVKELLKNYLGRVKQVSSGHLLLTEVF